MKRERHAMRCQDKERTDGGNQHDRWHFAAAAVVAWCGTAAAWSRPPVGDVPRVNLVVGYSKTSD